MSVYVYWLLYQSCDLMVLPGWKEEPMCLSCFFPRHKYKSFHTVQAHLSMRRVANKHSPSDQTYAVVSATNWHAHTGICLVRERSAHTIPRLTNLSWCGILHSHPEWSRKCSDSSLHVIPSRWGSQNWDCWDPGGRSHSEQSMSPLTTACGTGSSKRSVSVTTSQKQLWKKLQLFRYKCKFWFCGCLQKMKL